MKKAQKIPTGYDEILDFVRQTEHIDQEFDGKSLAMHCIDNGDPESLKILIKSGCKTTGLLHEAIRQNKKSILDSLIECDVNLDETIEDNITALNLAAKLNRVPFVRSLIDHGADPTIADSTGLGYIPITYACENVNLEMVQLLLEGHSPTRALESPMIPLCIACQKNAVSIVYLLLQYCADPNYHNIGTEPPLQIAINNENKDIVNILVAAGADVPDDILKQLPPGIVQQWIDPSLPFIPEPNPHADLDKLLKQITDELQGQQAGIGRYITNSQDIDFHVDFISPTLNAQSTMLVAFMKLVKKVDFFGKVLFQRKVQLLAQQYAIICAAERAKMESLYDPDDASLAQLIEVTKEIVAEHVEAFRPDTTVALETMGAQLPRRREENLPKRFAADAEVGRINRTVLRYLNQFLELYTMLVAETDALFASFSDAFRGVLDKALAALSEFRDALLEVRQTAADIVVDPKWAKESKVDATCVKQCDRIQIDTAFLLWERERFDTMAAKVSKALRLALH